MTSSPAEQAAMTRALDLAASPTVPLGPNPRVGCVLLDDSGATVAEGYHRGAGSPHAEAGERARGSTAVVTHEPCAHTGHSGPCAVALRDAGPRGTDALGAGPSAVADLGITTIADAFGHG